MITVDTAMKPITNHFSFSMMNGCRVFKKDTDVYAAPMMEVIAANRIT